MSRGEGRTFQPARVIVGTCPECGRLLVILNDHEVWPPARCTCGWVDGTSGLENKIRMERIMPWERKP